MAGLMMSVTSIDSEFMNDEPMEMDGDEVQK